MGDLTDLDDLIAQIDQDAFGSVYGVSSTASVSAPTTKDRSDSLSEMLAQLDLEGIDDVHSSKNPRGSVSSLMAYPVEVPDWQEDENNGANSNPVVYGINRNQPPQMMTASFGSYNSRPVSVQSPVGSAGTTFTGELPVQQAEIAVACFEPEEFMVEETLPDYDDNSYSNRNSVAVEEGGYVPSYRDGKNTFSQPVTQHYTAPAAVTNNPDLGSHDKICYKCNQGIGVEQRILAQGQLYHLRCWCCKKCGFELRAAKYFIKDDAPFCESCYSNVLCETCKKCGNAIQGQMIEAMSGTWHPNCFVCTSCGCSFGDRGFFARGDSPFCENCIHAPQSSATARGRANCAGCGSLVMGEGSFTGLGKTWHRRCFKCAVCNVELWSQPFVGKPDGRAYCQTHGT